MIARLVRRPVVWGGAVAVLLFGLLGAAIATGVYHQAYRSLLYSVVAQRVTRDAVTTAEKVERLQEFVYLNVTTPGNTPIIDDTAADVLIRGVGYCDQAAWALGRLASELGVPGRMFYLQSTEGNSPHTVAELYLDGRWQVYDVLYGFVPKHPDGSGATVEDLIANPSLLDPSRVSSDWYALGYEVPLVDGAATKLMQPIASAVASLPDPVANVLQDLYLRTTEPRPYSDINGASVETFETVESRQLYAARNYQLFQRENDAAREYRLLAQTRETPHVEDALYQLGLLRLDNQPVAASQLLHTLLWAFPETRWDDDAHYLAALADERLGRCEAAEEGFLEVTAGANRMEDSRARLANLPCGDGQTAQSRTTPG